MSAALEPSRLGPNLLVGPGVEIGAGVEIGGNVIVHAGTVVEDGAVLQDGAVLGKTATLAPHSSARGAGRGRLRVEAGATICTGAVVFAGARIGPGAIVGDQAHVREGAAVGAQTVIGRGSALGTDTTVGARVRVQTSVWLTSWTVVEDDVFLGPGVMTMNDQTMSRLVPGTPLRGPVLRRACRIGGGVLLTPGVEIGEEAFVAAGAVITHDVPPRARMMGIPGRRVGTVPDEDLLEHWR